ncbi:MAG: DUF4126 family protein [Candidatus Cloacimonetes bacterium]|nr:DUF4126 family protein [Candidatus Cloacimonadota bacterium]
MRKDSSIARSVLLGATAGMRTASAVAAVSRALARRPDRAHGRLQRGLAHSRVAKLLTTFAVGELAADKMPFLPSRIEPLPLAGRIGAGALAAVAATPPDEHGRIRAALAGALAAGAASYLAWRLRVTLDREGAPDALVALAEDVTMIEAARQGVAAMRV